MPIPNAHVDLALIDLNHPLVDHEGIYRIMPHRHEMQLLSAVVYEDTKQHIIAGYKDVKADEFWVRGHFPDRPVMPGVLMCEAAAQLTGFYSHRNKINEGVLIGLGGIENTRFRRTVSPGERLLLVAKGIRVRPRLTLFNVQGYVDGDFTFETEVMGVVLGKAGDAERA